MRKVFLQFLHSPHLFLKLLSSVLFLALIYFLFFSLVSPRYEQFKSTLFIDGVIAGLAVLGIVSLLRLERFDRMCTFFKSRIVTLFLFVAVFVIQYVVARALAVDPLVTGWDPQTVFQQAFILSGDRSFPDLTQYYDAYPNNLAIVAVVWVVIRVSDVIGVNYITVSTFFTSVVLTTTLFVMYSTVQRVLNAKTALIALLFGCLLVWFSPWSRTLYTDSVGMLFPILSLYLMLCIYSARSQSNRVFLGLLLGGVLGFGYLIKPTTIFIAFAAGIVMITFIIKKVYEHSVLRPSVLKAVALGSALLIGILIAAVPLKVYMVNKMDLSVDAMPVTSFAMMGLTTVCDIDSGQCRYGAWNLSDGLSRFNFSSTSQYRSYINKTIQQRLHNLGTVGYVKFLSQKGSWVLSDGTFYSYNEGVEKNAQLAHIGNLDKKIQSIAHPSGKYYHVFENVIEVVWLMLLFSCVAALVSARKYISEKSVKSFVFISVQIAILGLVVFLLLFEARSRYLFLYVPVFIVLASFFYAEVFAEKKQSRKFILKGKHRTQIS